MGDLVVERAERGDREAWEVLVARHDRRVVVSLLARGVPIDRARDLAQETWARLWEQQLAGKLGRLELPGLAIRQAGFLAADASRRRDRAADRVTDEALAEVADEGVAADEALVSRERVGRALAEIERLSPRAREVFVEVYDAPGVPHTETAVKVGMSVQRLRQTLCEVRARLKKAMEADDV